MNFDKIYADITANVIPKIAEWVQITKDYAFDLMWRYIKYLIITDSIWIVLSILWIIISILILTFWVKKVSEIDDDYISLPIFTWTLILVVSILFLFNDWTNLIKDLTVPEVRIYELYNANK